MLVSPQQENRKLVNHVCYELPGFPWNVLLPTTKYPAITNNSISMMIVSNKKLAFPYVYLQSSQTIYNLMCPGLISFFSSPFLGSFAPILVSSEKAFRLFGANLSLRVNLNFVPRFSIFLSLSAWVKTKEAKLERAAF